MNSKSNTSSTLRDYLPIHSPFEADEIVETLSSPKTNINVENNVFWMTVHI